jgi:hypothetical protein
MDDVLNEESSEGKRIYTVYRLRERVRVANSFLATFHTTLLITRPFLGTYKMCLATPQNGICQFLKVTHRPNHGFASKLLLFINACQPRDLRRKERKRCWAGLKLHGYVFRHGPVFTTNRAPKLGGVCCVFKFYAPKLDDQYQQPICTNV